MDISGTFKWVWALLSVEVCFLLHSFAILMLTTWEYCRIGPLTIPHWILQNNHLQQPPSRILFSLSHKTQHECSRSTLSNFIATNPTSTSTRCFLTFQTYDLHLMVYRFCYDIPCLRSFRPYVCSIPSSVHYVDSLSRYIAFVRLQSLKEMLNNRISLASKNSAILAYVKSVRLLFEPRLSTYWMHTGPKSYAASW